MSFGGRNLITLEGWIPADERLPDRGAHVLVTVVDRDGRMWTDTGWWPKDWQRWVDPLGHDLCDGDTTVLAWMQAPEPAKLELPWFDAPVRIYLRRGELTISRHGETLGHLPARLASPEAMQFVGDLGVLDDDQAREAIAHYAETGQYSLFLADLLADRCAEQEVA
ncbi:MAG: hypothetical protein AAF604_04750 [Acidobacteriota bacterium]